MSSGSPNWQKLHEMGKLPESARGNVPILAQLDVAEKKIKELEAEIAKLKSAGNESLIEIKCEVEGCEHVAEGRSEALAKNYMRLHMRTHEDKE